MKSIKRVIREARFNIKDFVIVAPYNDAYEMTINDYPDALIISDFGEPDDLELLLSKRP